MNQLDKIYKETLAIESELKKCFKKHYNNIINQNKNNGLGEYTCFTQWHALETDDKYDNPTPIQCGDNKIWLSNVWVSSNNPPQGVEMRDGRFPVKCVSMWYTPYCELRLDALEWFERAEKEKVLYKSHEIKISLIRRNVIPYAHSCQWNHKISKPEYVMYFNYRRAYSKDDLAWLEIHKNAINEITKKEERTDEDKKLILEHTREISSFNNNHYIWVECVHANTLRGLITKAKHYFNDWYVEQD